MAKELPYYKMYPKDFDADEKVRGLCLAEKGLFILCLNHAWTNEGLPNDEKVLPSMLGVGEQDFTFYWPRVSRCFQLNPDGRLVNARQEKERREAFFKSQKAKASANARWKTNELHATASNPQCERNASVALPRAYESDSSSDFNIKESNTSLQQKNGNGNGHANGDRFGAFWQMFVAAGKALNDRDKEYALREWMNHASSEQEIILRWIASQMQNTWRDAHHTPTPYNALMSQGWTRVAQDRTIPANGQPTKMQQTFEVLQRNLQHQAELDRRKGAK